MTIPQSNEEFELYIDNDIDPLELVKTANCTNWKEWKFVGPEFKTRTAKCRLIDLGYIKNLEQARSKAKDLGFQLLEGQAREAFKKKFPKHNNRPIVFGGNEWQDPGGDRFVACLRYVLLTGYGRSNFRWSDPGGGFGDRCLWAVEQVAQTPSPSQELKSFDLLKLKIIYDGKEYGIK